MSREAGAVGAASGDVPSWTRGAGGPAHGATGLDVPTSGGSPGHGTGGRFKLLKVNLRQAFQAARQALDGSRDPQEQEEDEDDEESAAPQRAETEVSLSRMRSMDGPSRAAWCGNTFGTLSPRHSQMSKVPSGAIRSAMLLLESNVEEPEDAAPPGAPSLPGISQFLQSDDGLFRTAVVLAIVLNMLVLIVETDSPEWPFWPVVDFAFLVFFALEFAAHVVQVGFKELLSTGSEPGWMTYDFVVLVIGAVDFFVCRLYARFLAVFLPVPGWDAVGPLVVRALVLSRLLRMYRLVRMHPKLIDFAQLLISILGTFALILGTFCVPCFMLGIVLVQLIGHRQLPFSDPAAEEHARSMFSDIPTSLFTMFQLTSMDNWADIIQPMVEVNVLWQLFFIAFIIFIPWTMLSFFTAVASEIMMSREKSKLQDAILEGKIKRHGFIPFLCGHFIEADADQRGSLDKDEFVSLMQQPWVAPEMEARGVELKSRDFARSFDAFDLDDSGELTIDEVVEGFFVMLQDLSTKHLASMEHSLKRFSRRHDKGVDFALQHFTRMEQLQAALAKKLDETRETPLGCNVADIVLLPPPEPPAPAVKPRGLRKPASFAVATGSRAPSDFAR